jgi:hypothetical protein
MNRVCVIFDPTGSIASVVADEPVRILFVEGGIARCPVVEFDTVQAGPGEVDRHIRGLPVAHLGREQDDD